MQAHVPWGLSGQVINIAGVMFAQASQNKYNELLAGDAQATFTIEHGDGEREDIVCSAHDLVPGDPAVPKSFAYGNDMHHGVASLTVCNIAAMMRRHALRRGSLVLHCKHTSDLCDKWGGAGQAPADAATTAWVEAAVGALAGSVAVVRRKAKGDVGAHDVQGLGNLVAVFACSGRSSSSTAQARALLHVGVADAGAGVEVLDPHRRQGAPRPEAADHVLVALHALLRLLTAKHALPGLTPTAMLDALVHKRTAEEERVRVVRLVWEACAKALDEHEVKEADCETLGDEDEHLSGIMAVYNAGAKVTGSKYTACKWMVDMPAALYHLCAFNYFCVSNVVVLKYSDDNKVDPAAARADVQGMSDWHYGWKDAFGLPD